MSFLSILRPGLSDTLQDLGRPGYRSWGVPASGAFDLDAHGLANALLGNPPGATTLELTLMGGQYQADSYLAIALAGAPMAAAIGREGGGRDDLRIPQSATLRPGDRLVLGGTAVGARTYLAARGGWQADSWSLGYHAEPSSTPTRRPSPALLGLPPFGPIRIIDGPDAVLAPTGWETHEFRLGPQCNRMGLRLEGPSLDVAADPDRVSAPVAPGAVQVAGGQVILLGPDCGTMGGYPHVAHVISADLSRLAQLRPGDPVLLRRIGLEEARRFDREDRRRRADRHLLLSTLAAEDSGARLIGSLEGGCRARAERGARQLLIP